MKLREVMEERHETELQFGIFLNELGTMQKFPSSQASESSRTSTSLIKRSMIGAEEEGDGTADPPDPIAHARSPSGHLSPCGTGGAARLL